MINTFTNISGKLPEGLVKLYREVIDIAEPLGIRTLVVGAMARDLILVHGYGAAIERGTKDVDFGINVANWNDFHNLKSELVKIGFREVPSWPHRLERNSSDGLPWEIDIIPFGEITNSNEEIYWPPDNDFVMSVLGFDDVEKHALQVRICNEPEITLSVAPPAGVALLKLIAWLERDRSIRTKDAADISYIIDTYSKIPEIYDAIFTQGHMDAQDWDESRANAMKLGLDTADIAGENTTKFLVNGLFNQPEKLEQLAREMPGYRYSDPEELLSVFVKSFRDNSKFIKG